MPRGKKSRRSPPGAGTIRKKAVTKKGKKYEYWEARFTAGFDPITGKQQQRSITGKTQAEVAQKLRETTAEIGLGTYVQPCKLTAAQWLDIWEQDYIADLKPASAESYHYQIKNHLKPGLGRVTLDKLTPHAIQHFYNSLSKEGLSPSSVHHVHNILHRALQQAVALGYLRDNPTARCKLPRVERTELKPLEDEDIRRFMEAVKNCPYEILLTVALFTGMRRGEVLGLTWSCVDFDGGTLLIDKQLQRVKEVSGKSVYKLTSPKSGKWRRMAPASFVMELLRRQWSRQAEWRLRAGPAWEDSGLVFTDELGGHLFPGAVYCAFKEIARAIGKPETRFHDLRHSYAVAAIRSGDDIKTVQSNLGHASAAFTLNVYGHITEKMQQESAARMDKFIKSISG